MIISSKIQTLSLKISDSLETVPNKTTKLEDRLNSSIQVCAVSRWNELKWTEMNWNELKWLNLPLSIETYKHFHTISTISPRHPVPKLGLILTVFKLFSNTMFKETCIFKQSCLKKCFFLVRKYNFLLKTPTLKS